MLAVSLAGCGGKDVSAQDVIDEFVSMSEGKEIMRYSGEIHYRTPVGLDSVPFTIVSLGDGKAVVSATFDIGGGKRAYDNFLIINKGKVFVDCKQMLPFADGMFFGAEDLITDHVYDSFIELVDLSEYADDQLVVSVKTVVSSIYDKVVGEKASVQDGHSCFYSYKADGDSDMTDFVSSLFDRNKEQLAADLQAFDSRINESSQAQGWLSVRTALQQPADKLIDLSGVMESVSTIKIASFSAQLKCIPDTSKAQITASCSFTMHDDPYSFDVQIDVDAPAQVEGKDRSVYESITEGKDRRAVKLETLCEEMYELLTAFAEKDDVETYSSVMYGQDFATRVYDYQYYKIKETFYFTKNQISRYECVLFDVENPEAAELFKRSASDSRYSVLRGSADETAYYTTDYDLFPADVREMSYTGPKDLAEQFGPAVEQPKDSKKVTRNNNGILLDVTKDGVRTTVLLEDEGTGSILRATVTCYNNASVDRVALVSQGYVFTNDSEPTVYYSEDPDLILLTLQSFGAAVRGLSTDAAYLALQ